MYTSVATKSWFSGRSLISSPFPNYRVLSIATARELSIVVICKCAFGPATTTFSLDPRIPFSQYSLSLSLSLPSALSSAIRIFGISMTKLQIEPVALGEFRFLSISILSDCHYGDAYFGFGRNLKAINTRHGGHAIRRRERRRVRASPERSFCSTNIPPPYNKPYTSRYPCLKSVSTLRVTIEQ